VTEFVCNSIARIIHSILVIFGIQG